MARPSATNSTYQSRTFALLCGVTAVAALYFAKAILLPFAIAVLLSFMLAPVAERLERWRFPRTVAVCVVAGIAFSVLGALSYVVLLQVYDLAYDLPKHKENIVAKAKSFQSSEDGLVRRLTTFWEQAREEIADDKSGGQQEGEEQPENANAEQQGDERQSRDDAEPRAEANEGTKTEPAEVAGDAAEQSLLEQLPNPNVVPGAEEAADGRDELVTEKESTAQDGAENEESSPSDEPEPIQVEVVEQVTARDVAQNVLGPLLGPLGNIAIIAVFVIFMLLAREDLRNRLIKLVGADQLNITTQAIDDAAHRVSRYLLMQLIINVSYGVVIAIGLYFIGLPNAILWGALTAVLRFVPFIGPWIAAAMPLALSLAVFDHWMGPILVVSLFVVNELISNNIMEPWLYGSSTGISTFGIILSAAFWTWLWGPVGLIIATPLTVCFTVMGRYVPQLAFLNTLISDEEVLPPASNVYQRLLALDPEEAIEVAEAYLEEHTLVQLYDDVLLPALSLAEQDRHRGELDEAKQRLILQTMHELVEDMGTRAQQAGEGKATADGEASAKPVTSDLTLPQRVVLCLPARDEADEIVGEMLVFLLTERGVDAEVLSTTALAGEMLERLGQHTAKVVCISALPPHAATHARYLAKRVRPRFPELRILVGLWESGGSTKKAQQRLLETGIDGVVTTLAAAVEQIEQAAYTHRVVHHSA